MSFCQLAWHSALYQLFHQRFAVANPLRSVLKILLHQPHKQEIGQHHLRAGRRDGGAARGLLLRNGVQAQRSLLLKRVGVKTGERQDLAPYP